ncbi:hypothetical protein HDV06_001645 [Boothiomyces sp. JEL0866]|nr:hypothetical protein HDV06_001645 [Boothiomyces sp. JEL0866]
MSMHSKHYQIKQREKHEAAQIQKQVIKDQGAPIRQEVDLIRKTFDKYDFDKNGNISEKEFRLLCADMGYFLSDKEAKVDMKILDKDGNGQIGFEEFLSWWKREDRFKILQIPPEDLEVLQLITQDFNKFDRDSSGSIDINEFKQLHAELIRRGVTQRNLIQTLNVTMINPGIRSKQGWKNSV